MTLTVTNDVVEAARRLRAGALVVFPTETVYGLGADLFDAAAIRAVYRAKGRPADNPLIVHVHARTEIGPLATTLPDAAVRLLDAHTPGPLTVIVPAASHVPRVARAGLPTVGIRIPAHPRARAFLQACDRPVAAPSANRSGRPSPTRWQAVADDLGDAGPTILIGGPSEMGLESTVVDATTDPPLVLRLGALPIEQLRATLPGLVLAGSPDALARSPGTRHRHYAPRIPVRVVPGPPTERPQIPTAFIGPSAPTVPLELVFVAPSLAAYAHELFAFFRDAERQGAHQILCERVPEVGIGRAIMDRVQRASKA